MSMEFETMSHTPSYMEVPEGSTLFDTSMEYLQFDGTSTSPCFDAPIGLPNAAASPLTGYSVLNDAYSYASAFNNHPGTPAIDSISPPMLSYNLSAGDVSDDSGRRSRGASHSPASYTAAVPRSVRYNPISIPSTRSSARTASKRRNSKSSVDKDSDDAEEEEDYRPSGNRSADPRREEIRRQRIDSEQRRRDELRDSFGHLKAVLPTSSQKASKIVLLDRTIQYIKEQNAKISHSELRIQALENELTQQRRLNERLSLQNVQVLMSRDGMSQCGPPVSSF